MKRMCTFALALVAAVLSTSGEAAKPAPSKCSASLLAPSGLTVESDGGTITSSWNEVNDIAKEATKYSVEVTAHYDGHGDVKFGFTAFDDDPGELDTASLAISASGLDTTVCNNPPDCTDTTTYSANSVTVQVKGLNPPTPKGKDQSQCNPFSAPVTASVEPSATCPCFDAADLASLSADGAYIECKANLTESVVLTWLVSGPTIMTAWASTSIFGYPKTCHIAFGPFDSIDVGNMSVAEFDACTSLIEAAQVVVGCESCAGANCPP